MSRSSTFRNIAGDVFEVTLLSALRTEIRWRWSREKKAALAALPVSQTTLWTDIPLEPARGCIAAVCTYPLLRFLLHVSALQALLVCSFGFSLNYALQLAKLTR